METERVARMGSCKNGHYYDQQKNSSCPYCNNSQSGLSDIQDTVNSGTELSSHGETSIYPGRKKRNYNETKMMLFGKIVEEERIIKKDIESIQIAGWIVIVSDKYQGESFVLTYGMNTIGREGVKNHISLNNGDNSISREKHASIIYDFENNKFFIQHNDGKYLTYRNRQLVSGLTELNPYDKIKIGKTELVFVPLCGEEFQWDKEEKN